MMFSRITVVVATLLCGCQPFESSLDLHGQWIDLNCADISKSCNSRYPIIKIDTNFTDTLFVKKTDGTWESKWTNHKWESFSLILENGYESLLYPNYKTNTLQYYDNTTKRFVYYSKSTSL
jgi:hypothetical protein